VECYSFPLQISLGRDRARIKFNCSRTINNCVNHYTSDMRTYVPHPSHCKKNVYLYICRVLFIVYFKANPDQGIVCLAEPRIISVARGRKSAGGKERYDGGQRGVGGSEQRGALLSLQSRVRPHSFICSAAEVLNLRCEIPDDHPPWAPGLVYGSCVSALYVHICALVHAAQQRLSQLAPTSVRMGRIISLRSSKNLCIM